MEIQNVTMTTVPWLLQPLFSPRCYDTLVQDLQWTDGVCLQLLASKIISYIIIISTIFLTHLPQTVVLLRSHSAAGISVGSQLLMLVTSSAGTSYSIIKGFPISTYGEMIFLNLQVMLNVFLVLAYTGSTRTGVLYTCVYVVAMTTLLSPLVPLPAHQWLQMLCVPCSAISKFLQIRTNFKNDGTGQLAGMTVMMRFLRTSGRLYSQITETGDPYRITVYISATSLNALLASQFAFYNLLGRKARDSTKQQTTKDKTV